MSESPPTKESKLRPEGLLDTHCPVDLNPEETISRM